MRKLCMVLIAVFTLITAVSGQNLYELSGKVYDADGLVLPGASVVLSPGKTGTVTEANGNFHFSGLEARVYVVYVSFVGYKSFSDTIEIRASQNIDVKMQPSIMTLHEVVVKDNFAKQRNQEDSRNVEVVNDRFVKMNLSGSLMKSLERIPGVSTIDIGSGQSKPVIRGLGFNRIVVTENGIKHEGQQWGEDHGLEIDQYAVDRVEVIKGPASLMYGSDAIGGVIDIKQLDVPVENSFGGSVDLTGKSNNNLLGTSINIFAKRKVLYFTGRVTLLDFADYRVPTDSVDIYSYKAALYKNRLRNTAGNEKDFHFSVGAIGQRFSTRFYFSDVHSKNGFFANAHGLEPRNVDTELHDRSDRDIQYPYQEVNHLKITNQSEWHGNNFNLEMELGFQNNFREEWSQYVGHGYMPATFPGSLSFPADLERQFDKNVFSGNLKASFNPVDNFSVMAGMSSEFQDNNIGGRGFIIPAFKQTAVGIFLYGKYYLSLNSILQAGVRFDYGKINTEAYSDWFPSPAENAGDTVWSYLQRAPEISRSFNNISWSLGFNQNWDKVSLKANIGKSFRMPIAKELAANGVNYHRFSYEVGDPDLSPEVSYQLDLGAEYNSTNFAVGISPFVNYFPNYIYLNPSSEHDRLYGNGNQVFYYKQSEVLRFGGEIHSHIKLYPLTIGVIGEYVYSEQLSGEKKGFTLPFSPPVSLLFNAKYSQENIGWLKNPYFSVDYKLVARQNRIVPPEEKTDGYQVVKLSMGGDLNFGKESISIAFQVQNVFNQKYFNHTSYYRLINVPEAGRNFVLNINIPFNNKL